MGCQRPAEAENGREREPGPNHPSLKGHDGTPSCVVMSSRQSSVLTFVPSHFTPKARPHWRRVRSGVWSEGLAYLAAHERSESSEPRTLASG
jgi:hypothetical protein